MGKGVPLIAVVVVKGDVLPHKAVATQLADALGNRAYKTHIRKAVKVKEATFTPGSLIDFARNCTAVQDYRALVKEYLEED